MCVADSSADEEYPSKYYHYLDQKLQELTYMTGHIVEPSVVGAVDNFFANLHLKVRLASIFVESGVQIRGIGY